jgi:hypothetical protein
MMEFAQIYDDPEIVKICLETVEDNMPSFLSSEMFLKLCPTCVYKIAQHDRYLAPEEVIFERVLKWSVEYCTKQKLPVTIENQRKVLGDILCEIRFPIMDHQYLDDVICGSKLLNDGEKVDILRQQLKSKNEKPGKFKIRERVLQPTEVTFSHVHSSRTKSIYQRANIEYPLRFKISSYSLLLGIYLNIDRYENFNAEDCTVIISIKPLNFFRGDTVEDFSTPLSEVKENLIELYPRFVIPFPKGVELMVSISFRCESTDRPSMLCKEIELLDTNVEFKGKTLSVIRSRDNRRPGDYLIRGLRIS